MEIVMTILATMSIQLGLCIFCFIKKTDAVKNWATS
jgi:hypothetical protein